MTPYIANSTNTHLCIELFIYFSLKYSLKHRSGRFNTIPKADVYQIIQSNWFCVHIIVQVILELKIWSPSLTNVEWHSRAWLYTVTTYTNQTLQLACGQTSLQVNTLTQNDWSVKNQIEYTSLRPEFIRAPPSKTREPYSNHSVCLSVCPSVRLSVRLSVHPHFVVMW